MARYAASATRGSKPASAARARTSATTCSTRGSASHLRARRLEARGLPDGAATLGHQADDLAVEPGDVGAHLVE